MSVQIFIMPILVLIVGIISLFTNPVDPKKKLLIRILVGSLFLTCVLDIYVKTESQRKDDKELAWSKERIKELIETLSSFRFESNENFDNIAKMLKDFGWTNEKIQNTFEIKQSFIAEEERNLIALSGSIERRRAVTLEYLPKDVDRDKVEIALKELGFRLVTGPTQIYDVPTNAIWFGLEVHINDVKLVAYTLIRAGVQIKAIRPFRNPRGERASLIQVGADAIFVNAPALTVEEIRAASEFIRTE